ncbi:MAG: hypothetical protein SGILL_010199 [Bacillariaceae sp.]
MTATEDIGNAKSKNISGHKRSRKQRPPKLDPKTCRVVVVGAGLAGLSAALALTQAGFKNVFIYERDPSLEYQKEGYGLTLTYNPRGPLSKLGILEQVALQDCPSRSHYLFRAIDGLPLGYFGNAFFLHDSGNSSSSTRPRRGHGQRGNLRVPRKVLRRILYETLVNEKTNLANEATEPAVHWGHKLKDFRWDVCSQQYSMVFEQEREPQKQVTADLLVAADGIRSTVLQKLYITNHHKHSSSSSVPPSIHESPEWYGLKSMGIRVILGIAEFDSNSELQNNADHPLQLLKERGFYTLDGQGRRLFTMPYQSNRFSEDQSTVDNRIMWQLSFLTTDQDSQQPLDAVFLRQHVLDTCQSWHKPVVDLIRATPIEYVWGTDLMDRNSRKFYQELVCGGEHRQQKPLYPRLAVLGDALHSMSPFKGQGANQALADGPLLSQCLLKSSADAAISGWWRETLNRTVPIVEASRKAAQELHSCRVTTQEEGCMDDASMTSTSLHGFAGVNPEAIPKLVKTLHRGDIGAHLGKNLDDAISLVLVENNWLHIRDKVNEKSGDVKQWQQEALRFAKGGETQGLRQMSLDAAKCSGIVPARGSEERSCLHLAVLQNHLGTSQWLLVELQCCVTAKDAHGKTAYDYCIQNENARLAHIFRVVKREKSSR